MHSCRAAAFLAVLLLVPGAASSAQELPEALQAPFEEGVAALRAQKLDEAEAAFQRVLQQGGRAAYVYNNLGIVYQQRGQHQKAVAEFREAIRVDPAYAAPRVLLGVSLLAQGQLPEARAQLERAVKLKPAEPLARRELARACERAGDLPAAIDQYRELRKLAPEDPEYAYALGKAYGSLSEWCLQEIKRLDPRSARLFQALGHNYRVQGRLDLAQRAFERAAQADPTLPEVHLALAQIHLSEKRWAEARLELELERALVPESVGVRALMQRLQAEEPKSP